MRRYSILLVLLLALVLGTTPAFAHEESEQAYKDAIQLLADEGLTAGNPDVIDQVFASEAMIHLPPSFSADPVTPEGYKFIVTSLKDAMPDFAATLDLIIADDDWVAYRLTWHGTFTNPMERPDGGAFEPTGSPIELSFNTIGQFNEEGQVVEEWTEFDNLSWLTQLGLIPAPEGAEVSAADDIAAAPVEMVELGMDDEIRDSIVTLVDQAFNQGDVSIIGEAYTADYISHPPETVEEFQQSVLALRAAIPDLTASADDIVVEGNLAAFRFTMQGTFTNELALGEMPAIPATGQPVALAINIILRFDEQGRVVEEWDELDNLGWLTQLGVIPAPAAS